MAIRRSDVVDSDFVEVPELASDGYSTYLLAISVVSTTSGTHTVVISPIPDGQGLTLIAGDHPVQVNDRVQLYGTTGADGYYTIASIVNDVTFTVYEPIPSSIDGYVNFIYPPGASTVGLDVTLLPGTGITSTNVQGAFGQVLTPELHETLRQLIHFIDDGPADGFLSGAYKEISPVPSLYPTSVIWYVDSTKTQKIVEQTIVWTGVVPTTITWEVYNSDGTTVAHTVSDTISYTNNIFETSRTRTIT